MPEVLTPIVVPKPVAPAPMTIAAADASLGDRARRMKRRHRLRRLVRAVIAASVVWIGALITGFVLNGLGLGGLGIGGLIVAFFAVAVVFALFLSFPRMKAPAPADIARSDLKAIAGRTELFLEGQRSALPPPAQAEVDRIARALDQLSPQLATLGENDPAAGNARRLLGEHLPGLIDSYTRIPAGVRGGADGDDTPERQLVAGLEIIAREIDAMTGEIARGDLDALATRGRYLETKYAG